MKNKFQITVSEPWDFTGTDGQNLIKGSVIKVISEEYLVFKSSSTLNFGDMTGQLLLLKPRIYEDNFSSLNSDIAINGGLITNYEEHLSIEDLCSNTIFVIIGSLSQLGIDG